jgi:DNA-binding NarL/FixJ family response regulator
VPPAAVEELRVLVADDDPVVRTITGAVVAGHDGLQLVAEADGGASALRIALLHRPDVLVVDHDLGDMTAGQLVVRLRAAGLHLRVLLHSGRDDVHDLGRQMGVAASSSKADGPDGLREALGALLPR